MGRTDGTIAKLPSRIVKIVYSEESFTRDENDRGHFNLIHYLYFYNEDDNFKHRLEAAWRKGSKVYVFKCSYELLGEAQSVQDMKQWE